MGGESASGDVGGLRGRVDGADGAGAVDRQRHVKVADQKSNVIAFFAKVFLLLSAGHESVVVDSDNLNGN